MKTKQRVFIKYSKATMIVNTSKYIPLGVKSSRREMGQWSFVTNLVTNVFAVGTVGVICKLQSCSSFGNGWRGVWLHSLLIPTPGHLKLHSACFSVSHTVKTQKYTFELREECLVKCVFKDIKVFNVQYILPCAL